MTVRYANVPGQAIVNFPDRGENDIQGLAGFSGGMALASLLSVHVRVITRATCTPS